MTMIVVRRSVVEPTQADFFAAVQASPIPKWSKSSIHIYRESPPPR